MTNLLSMIQDWYQDQCDGEWEHSYGVRIDTLDNPGWSVKIDPPPGSATQLRDREIKIDRTESDWISCRLVSGKYEAFGGSKNLEELLQVFLDWQHDETEPGETS